MSTAIRTQVKLLPLIALMHLLATACSRPSNGLDEEASSGSATPASPVQQVEPVAVLSPEQQAAFDALNTLQVSSDGMSRLYSTFAGIQQPCYPADTSLTISQAELLMALRAFVANNCDDLSFKEGEELAATAVLAQEEYTVLLCLDGVAAVSYEDGVPMAGTWVMPNVLGRRDVIVAW